MLIVAEKKREPSRVAKHVMEQFRRLKALRGYTFAEIVKRGGKDQPYWTRWEAGAPPELDNLEVTATALDAELVVEVRDKRAQPRTITPPGLSRTAIEVAIVVDQLHDQAAKEWMRDAVYRLKDAAPPPLAVVQTPENNSKKTK